MAHCQKTLVYAMFLSFAAEKGNKRLPKKVIFRVFSDYCFPWVGDRLCETKIDTKLVLTLLAFVPPAQVCFFMAMILTNIIRVE